MQCIKAYQISSLAIRSLAAIFGVGTQCKFAESCSCFAARQISSSDVSLIEAIQRIALRLMMCSPLYGFLVKEK